MKYEGKLFGQIGQTRKYFDTGRTSDEWDAMEARIEELEGNAKNWEKHLAASLARASLIIAKDATFDRVATEEQIIELAVEFHRTIADQLLSDIPKLSNA